jgi:hypothetical protein
MSTIIPSKPIPIPPREADPHLNNEMMNAREAAEIYDAATWRMFQLITSARLRAASSNFCYYCKVVHHPSSQLQHVVLTQDDHDATAATTTPSQQQLEAARRDRVYSLKPEPPSVSQTPSSSMGTEYSLWICRY